jgi:hypothetical protein
VELLIFLKKNTYNSLSSNFYALKKLSQPEAKREQAI